MGYNPLMIAFLKHVFERIGFFFTVMVRVPPGC